MKKDCLIDAIPPRCRAWRKRIFERDNYTCQISGERGGRLCAHHIEAWNVNPSLRFKTSNGITISHKLHSLFHKIYGRGGNTKMQFQEFVEKSLDCLQNTTKV